MEFPYSNQPSVNESTGQRLNIKPKASDGFGRGAQGFFRDHSGINLGGNIDVRRALDPLSAGPSRVPSAINYGQPNPAGAAAGVDSDGMLSLDDILNDLHKKVVAVDVNAYEVKGQPGNPLGFRSEKLAEAYGSIDGNRVGEYKGEGAGSLGRKEGYGGEPQSKDGYNVEADGSRRREVQFNAEVVGKTRRNEQLKGQVAGLREATQVIGVLRRNEEPKYGVVGLLDGSGQQMNEGTCSLEMNQQFKVGIAESAERSEKGEAATLYVAGDQYKSEVPGSKYESEATNPHVQGELYKNTVAGPVVVGEQNKGEAAGPQGTSEQHKGETAGLYGTSEQQTGEATVVNGTIEQYKGEVAGTVQIDDQNQGKGKIILQEQGEKALGQAIEPVFRTPDGRGGKSRRHTEIIQSPDWLPKGWFTELKTRGGGSSAGTKDKYYYDPVTQRRFRSKIEVLSFLETGLIGRYKPKVKSEGQVGRKRKTSAAFYQYAASFDNSFRPTKVRWVLNDTDGSWIPFVNEENSVDFNQKEGERLFDLNRNGADACDHGQGEVTVLKDTKPLRSLKSDIIEVVIDPSTQKKVSEDILPFVDSWSDPCLEFAVKTLTGAFPNLEENLALKHAVEKLLVGSSDSNPVGSKAFPGVSGCGKCLECPSLAKEQLQFKRKLHESSTSQHILSALSLPERALNKYKHGCRENQLGSQQVKVLLEPLGRKLCNRALDFLKGHKHSSLHLGKQAKNISMSFHLIDYGHQKQTILNSPSALCD